MLPYIAQPTGMDVAPDGSMGVIVSYYGVFLFPRSGKESWGEAFGKPPVILPPHGMAQAARAAARDAAEASLRGQFESIDANDDAAIGADEYPNLMLVRRAGASAPALAAFDANRDGRLQFGEYLAMVRQLAKPR